MSADEDQFCKVRNKKGKKQNHLSLAFYWPLKFYSTLTFNFLGNDKNDK
jgi:hypothetical protein